MESNVETQDPGEGTMEGTVEATLEGTVDTAHSEGKFKKKTFHCGKVRSNNFDLFLHYINGVY